MNSSGIKIFSAMREKMSYMSERQRVIAQNIANANTPGYKAKDVKMDFNDLLTSKSGNNAMMKTTHPGHVQGGGGSGSSHGFKIIETESTDITPNGNNVVIEEELLKMQGNNMDYQTTTNLYKKMTLMLRTALGDN